MITISRVRWTCTLAAAALALAGGIAPAAADGPTGYHSPYQSGGQADNIHPGGNYHGGNGYHAGNSYHGNNGYHGNGYHNGQTAYRHERHYGYGGGYVEPGYGYDGPAYVEDPGYYPAYRPAPGCIPALGLVTGDFCGY